MSWNEIVVGEGMDEQGNAFNYCARKYLNGASDAGSMEDNVQVSGIKPRGRGRKK